MGKGKPRHMNENQMKKHCNLWSSGNIGTPTNCICWDGYEKEDGTIVYQYEMPYPWCISKTNKCDGNVHNCLRRKYHWIASLSEKERKKYLENLK